MPDVHSDLLGGSSAERRAHCAASYVLEQGIPGTESPAASRGTKLHALIASELSSGDTVTGTPEENRIIERAFDAFDELCERYSIEKVIVERQVNPQLVMESFGTVDVIGIGPEYALVLDWKFGFHPVDAQDNQQLHYYAYAAMMDPQVGPMMAHCTKLVTAIVQPSRTPVVSEADVSLSDLEASASTWVHNYALRDSDPVKGSWCQWCKAKPVCPAHEPGEESSESADYMATPISILKAHPFTLYGNVHEMSDQLKVWKELAGWVTERANTLERLVFARAEAGERVPGWKLVAKRARSAWTDPEKAERILRRAVGVDEACPRQLVSPTQAQKLKGVDKDAISRYITRDSTGVKLVPADSELEGVDVSTRFTELGKEIQDKS